MHKKGFCYWKPYEFEVQSVKHASMYINEFQGFLN